MWSRLVRTPSGKCEREIIISVLVLFGKVCIEINVTWPWWGYHMFSYISKLICIHICDSRHNQYLWHLIKYILKVNYSPRTKVVWLIKMSISSQVIWWTNPSEGHNHWVSMGIFCRSFAHYLYITCTFRWLDLLTDSLT